MRIYEVKIKGRFENEDGQDDTFSFTRYFRSVPTKEQVVNAFMQIPTKGIPREASSKLAHYLPMVEQHPDLQFEDNSGIGRPIYPELEEHEWRIPPQARETCYLSFTYHDVIEN